MTIHIPDLNSVINSSVRLYECQGEYYLNNMVELREPHGKEIEEWSNKDHDCWACKLFLIRWGSEFINKKCTKWP
jgi:bifunctional N-acetylglucosamine-1-phosphate-uridyltransferase/glucosamine-1-phosphate-acetyltransferase GlmU-like protein